MKESIDKCWLICRVKVGTKNWVCRGQTSMLDDLDNIEVMFCHLRVVNRSNMPRQ